MMARRGQTMQALLQMGKGFQDYGAGVRTAQQDEIQEQERQRVAELDTKRMGMAEAREVRESTLFGQQQDEFQRKLGIREQLEARQASIADDPNWASNEHKANVLSEISRFQSMLGKGDFRTSDDFIKGFQSDAAKAKAADLQNQATQAGIITEGLKQNEIKKKTSMIGQPKPGDTKFNASQGVSAGFASRMIAAKKELDTLMSDGYKPNRIGGIAPNELKTANRQMYEQLQADWVSANLRKESGAAIPPSEMEQEKKKYFPQPGDSEEVKARKAEARNIAEQAMIVQAGPAYDLVQNRLQSQNMETQQGGLQVGTVDGGYKFLGGDPSDPSSWRQL
jgi:hypothetical protein